MRFLSYIKCFPTALQYCGYNYYWQSVRRYGFGIVVARCFGVGNENKIKESVANSLVIGIGVIIIVMTISALFLKSLLVALRTPDEIIDMAYNYNRIIAMFSAVMFLYNHFAGLLRAIGNSIIMPLIFLIISSLLNIGLDILFVVYLGFGVEGAAVATVIAQGVSVIIVALYVLRKAPILIPRLKSLTRSY